MSEQRPERKRRIPPVVIVGIIMAALCGISLYIRMALPYDHVFVNDWVWFRETDAYYYLRNIETLVHNSLHFNSFDPYMLYPGGAGGLIRPFFAWLVAAVTLLVTPGTPSLHTIETVAAYMPAILGTLTLIPVYFIGKELFNRWVGVISAALVAILPGELMHRSLLSFVDHHVAEALFSTVCMLFLIMAVKRAREREVSFDHILKRNWSAIARPLIYAVVAGIFLGIYLLSWQGGLFFVFVVFACLVVQGIVDHLRHRSGDYICIVGTPLFLVAFLMVLPVLSGDRFDTVYRISLPVAIVVPIVLSIISRLMAGRALKSIYYPLALVGLAGIGIAVLYAVNPSLFQYMAGLFSIFGRSGAALTIQEASPILFPFGEFTFAVAWANFTASFFIGFVSIVMLIYVAVKQGGADKVLFLVWSIIMLLAVLGQRRWGYYYAVNAALLTGYFSWKMLDIAGLGQLLAEPGRVVGAVKKFKKRDKRKKERAGQSTFMQPRGVWARVIIVGIIIFFLVFFPNIPRAEALAGSESPIMNEGWYTSSLWLNDNTPEPFENPDFYYDLYPPRNEFDYPDTAYGVMSWWDYGYFIMQIGHRIPNANPTQARAREAGRFFTAQNESAANALADTLGTGYVMIDYMMATPSKFYAMVDWTDGDLDQFYEVYYFYRSQASQIMPVPLAHPAYYQSSAVRLYFFDGEEQPGSNTLVISYQEQEGDEGTFYKAISSARLFSSYADAQDYISSQSLTGHIITGALPLGNLVVRYEDKMTGQGIHYQEITDFVFFPEPYYDYEDAQAFISSQQTGNYKVLDPFISPVPLEELERYELKPGSDVPYTFTTLGKQLPAVKIFEYLG